MRTEVRSFLLAVVSFSLRRTNKNWITANTSLSWHYFGVAPSKSLCLAAWEDLDFCKHSTHGPGIILFKIWRQHTVEIRFLDRYLETLAVHCRDTLGAQAQTDDSLLLQHLATDLQCSSLSSMLARRLPFPSAWWEEPMWCFCYMWTGGNA